MMKWLRREFISGYRVINCLGYRRKDKSGINMKKILGYRLTSTDTQNNWKEENKRQEVVEPFKKNKDYVSLCR